MLIKIIFIVIGALFIIYGIIYGLAQRNSPINHRGTFTSILLCCMGILLIVAGNWFIPDIFNDALEKRKLDESRKQYTYVYENNTVTYEDYNKQYNSLEYDITYDDTNKTATITKDKTTEQSTILLCCLCTLIVALSIRKKKSET